VTDWTPDASLLAALHEAAARQDLAGYLDTLLDACLVTPTDPDSGEWVVARDPQDRLVVPSFTSIEAMRASPIGAREQSYTLWPVLDLVAGWPDPQWSLLVDGTLPSQVWLAPETVAALADRVTERYPVDPALRAAAGDPEAYLQALLPADVVVPIRPAGSPSRDLTDPAFAWWSLGPADRPPEGITLFSTPVRLQSRLGDVPWLIAPFVDVLTNCPPDCAMLVDPDHHLGAALPAEMVTALRAELLRALADDRERRPETTAT
jgi:hypothetical protein